MATVNMRGYYNMAGMKSAEMDVMENVDYYDPDYYTDYWNIVHPLQNSWTLWYCHNDTRLTWEENQRELLTFSTVEEFWSIFTHIEKPTNLNRGCGYALFKTGIRPMWEDEANAKGGRWVIHLQKKRREKDLDKYWLETVLCLIGEAFEEHSDEVCGAVVNRRGRGGKIGLWTADAKKCISVVEIGRKLRERLNIGRTITFGYELHNDNMAKAIAVGNAY